ncbi:MAG: hypothetical protein HZA31_02680 [Opitutae bacterium]|nr:hypothetical protein [Opitutae bacterium]
MSQGAGPTAERRWQRIGAAFTGALAARAVGIGCGLLQVPLALGYLGLRDYGAWVILQTTAGLAGLIDLGTGFAAQNALTAHLAQSRHAAAHGVFWATLRRQTLFAIVATGLWLLWWRVGGGAAALLPGARELEPAMLHVVNLLIAVQLATAPAGLALRVALARQEGWWSGALAAATSASILLLVFLGALGTWSKPLLVAALALTPVILQGGLLIRWLAAAWPARREPTAALPRLRLSFAFFLPQAGMVARQYAPALAITAVLGPAAVAPYALIQRLLQWLTQPQSWLTEPLWPALTDAHARGDAKWMAQAERATQRVALGTAALLLSAPFWGRALLTLWTRQPPALFDHVLLGSMAAAAAALALAVPFSVWLNAMGRPQGQALYGTAAAAMFCAGLPLAVRYGGVAGAPQLELALTCTILLPAVLLDTWHTRRKLAGATPS